MSDEEIPKAIPERAKKVKIKSIFDDDDDSDDCDEVTIQIPAKIFNESSDTNNNSVEMKLKSEQLFATMRNDNTALQTSLEEPIIPALTLWESVEDENCVAAQYFAHQNAFDGGQVRVLHNCFIPLVNGNWNGVTRDKCQFDSMLLNNVDVREYPRSDVDFEAHGLDKSVVPSCSHLLMDKMPKACEEDLVCNFIVKMMKFSIYSCNFIYLFI